MRRRGFTLIEMLVVIGILAVLMGLTLGGIMAMKKTDRLLATEHLVGDVIRQARHTARTSGAPVLVSIRADEQGHGWISGLSRVPIWSESFDGPGTLGNITGATGQGLQVIIPTAPPRSVTLDKRLRIVRGGKADGFYLSCQVRPQQVVTGSGTIIPLLVIGPDATLANSFCGLMLRQVERDEQKLDNSFEPTADNSTMPASLPGYPIVPHLATWEIVGWINDSALPTGNPIEVSSIAIADRPVDLLRDEPALHASVPDQYDIAWPMAGDRWEEVGLLFDGEGQRLVLYRNGVRVGERRLGSVPVLESGDEKITVGELDPGPGAIYSGIAIIDEVAVHRLAASDPVRLPGDVRPTQPLHRIVAQPDGRVEVDYTQAVAAAAGSVSATSAFVAPDRVLSFAGSFNQAGRADLTVSIDGRVHGEIHP